MFTIKNNNSFSVLVIYAIGISFAVALWAFVFQPIVGAIPAPSFIFDVFHSLGSVTLGFFIWDLIVMQLIGVAVIAFILSREVLNLVDNRIIDGKSGDLFIKVAFALLIIFLELFFSVLLFNEQLVGEFKTAWWQHGHDYAVVISVIAALLSSYKR